MALKLVMSTDLAGMQYQQFYIVYIVTLLTKREVKMDIGWILAKFSFCVFVEQDKHKNAKRERDQYPAILTELAWPIKDLLYGIKNTSKRIFVLVYFRALKRKPVICKSDVLFSLFSFSLTLLVFSFSNSIPTEKSQKTFLLPRKIFCKRKLSCTRLDFGEILLRDQNRRSQAGNIGPSCPLR